MTVMGTIFLVLVVVNEVMNWKLRSLKDEAIEVQRETIGLMDDTIKSCERTIASQEETITLLCAVSSVPAIRTWGQLQTALTTDQTEDDNG